MTIEIPSLGDDKSSGENAAQGVYRAKDADYLMASFYALKGAGKKACIKEWELAVKREFPSISGQASSYAANLLFQMQSRRMGNLEMKLYIALGEL